MPGKHSENYIFSQTFDRAGRGWKVRGERLEKLLDCQTISLVTKNSHLCEKSEYNKMLYNEHSVDKFTVCSHSRALRHNSNTKNTLYFRLHTIPRKSPKISESAHIVAHHQHTIQPIPLGESVEHHVKLLYSQSINRYYLHLIILSIHDVILHMIHYDIII